MKQPPKRLPQSWSEAMLMNLPQSNPVLERVGDERAVLGRAVVNNKTRLEPVVNPAQWAMQVVADESCQKQADTKAFTGRGKLLELRQLLTELDRTVEAMKQLVEATKQVQGGQMHLVLHIKNSTGLTFLRWRERNGACRHVPWPEVQPRIAGLASTMQEWYRQASSQAVELNERHKELRRAIATARKVVLRSAPKVYARPISMG
jgi:hypothetical protein